MHTRQQQLSRAIGQHWDLIVIGGGITGAGILQEAAQAGLNALLLEQADFASGTSCRSSKLVHGGLRYLSHGHLRLTAESVRERQALMREVPGLVKPQGFCFPVRKGQKPGLGVTRIGLGLYDLLARQWQARKLDWDELDQYAPGLSVQELDGVLYFEDAQTDDSRLVLRLIQEACAAGATAVNYVQVDGLIEDKAKVGGVRCHVQGSEQIFEFKTDVVINATGAWSDRLGSNQAPSLRPLRGSHLIVPAARLPLPAAVSFLHPLDSRPVFAYEWEGVSLLGTTDLDHADDLDREPRISAQEVEYLLQAAYAAWPDAKLSRRDVIASYAGVRPVVASGADKPSDESRESAIWTQPGLVSVTGGKLTTFRITAREVLNKALPGRVKPRQQIFQSAAQLARPENCAPEDWLRLQGRYGPALPAVILKADAGDFSRIAHTPCLWLELKYAARAEQVRHLDDLLLRRTRLGLLLPDACRVQMPQIRAVCQPLLAWDDRRWGNEEGAWYRRWQDCYSLPAELDSAA